MSGKTLALTDLNKSMTDLHESLDVTFTGVRKEFDEINDDLDLLFTENKRLKRANKAISNKVNYLIGAVAFNTVISISVVLYLVFL